MLAPSLYATITCVWKKTTAIGEMPRFDLRAPYRPGVSAPHRSEKVAPSSPAAGALSPVSVQISAEKMSDKRRRKRLGSGDSEGSEDSEGPGVVEGKEEEKEGASSDPERDEGVVS